MSYSVDKFRVFSYLNADKAPIYRAVMRAFVDAKSRFALHLRQHEISVALAEPGNPSEEASPNLAAALEQLVEWGNLAMHPDTADVQTVEEFYRPRHLYQLTAEGEAAERALAFFRETLEQPGELQAAALGDIRDRLAELERLAAAAQLNAADAHRVLKDLASRFDELTSRAHVFIGGLQRTIDLHGIELEAFVRYKQMLIDYLERFIGELTVAAAAIADKIGQVERRDIDRLLQAAADRDIVDTFNPTDERRLAVLQWWQSRWAGLRAWFIRMPGSASQAEILRARARSAIPALLNAVISMNERRAMRSDRASDLRALARWFAQTDSDRQAHRLWRSAFALAPARHLSVSAETLESRDQRPVGAGVSWLEAPPVLISPRLRSHGRHAAAGPPKKIIDRSRERQMLAESVAAETAQVQTACRRLATGQVTRLSELAWLTEPEFQLFLELIGEALSKPNPFGEVTEVASTDGRLMIAMRPTPGSARAEIETPTGRFSGQDHFLSIRYSIGSCDLRQVGFPNAPDPSHETSIAFATAKETEQRSFE